MVGSAILGAKKHYHYDKDRWKEGFREKKPLKSLTCSIFSKGYTKMGRHHPKIKKRTVKNKWLCDSGPMICVAGTKFLKQFGMDVKDLIPNSIEVTSADSSHMTVLGIVLVKFEHNDRETCELVYICEGTQTSLLSYDACVALGLMSGGLGDIANDVNIVESNDEPLKADSQPDKPSFEDNDVEADKESGGCSDKERTGKCSCSCPPRRGPPAEIRRPEFPLNEEN